MVKQFGAVFGITCAVACGTAAAQSDAPYRLGEIIVSASPDRSTAAQLTFTKPSDELEAEGARFLDDAFTAIPGINVNVGGGGVPRIFLRGLPQRHAPLFLNGIPLNAASDGQLDPRLIPTEHIAEIKVVEGASSVLYGPGATGGLIDVVTRQGAGVFHGGMMLEANSGDTIGTAAGVVTTAHASGDVNGTDIFVSGSFVSTPGFVAADGTLRPNTDSQRGNGFASVARDLGDWKAGIAGGFLRGDQGIPYNATNDPANPFLMPQMFERLSGIAGSFGQADLSYAPQGPFSLRFSGYVNTLDERDQRFDSASFNSMSDATVQTFDKQVDTTVTGGRGLAAFAFDRAGTLSASVSAQREAEDITGSIRNVPVTTTGGGTGGGGGGGGKGGGGGGGGGGTGAAKPTFALAALDNHDSVTTTSTAVEYSVAPIARTHLTLGVSNHWFDRVGGSAEHAQWMAGFAVEATDELTASASFSSKVRFPTLQELYDPQKGNKALKPEVSDDDEAELAWTHGGFRLQASAFRNRIDNFIQNDQTTQVFTNKNTLTKGFEISGVAAVNENFHARAAYTYLDVTDQSGARVDFRPRHVFDLEGTYTPSPDWTLHAAMDYVADQVVSARAGAFQQQRLPDRALFDLRITRVFLGSGVRFWVASRNLGNNHYIYAPGFAAPGRSFIAGAAVDL